MNVLIIEDDPVQQKVLEATLRKALAAPLTVEICSSVTCGLKAAAKGNMALSFVDIDLKEGGSGLTFIREVRRWNTATPLVAITAEPGHRQAALAAGANCFLEKPIRARQFWALIEIFIGEDKTRSRCIHNCLLSD